MPNPANAKKFEDPMDPKDRVEFLVNLDGPTGLLETGETVASYTLTPSPEAVALGMQIGTGTYAPSQPTPTQILFWVEFSAGFHNNASFDAGVDLGIQVEITTSSVPARRRERTAIITVAQQ